MSERRGMTCHRCGHVYGWSHLEQLLDAIDGAQQDFPVSGDAMRWSPPKPRPPKPDPQQ
jgi:hypothetical protein